uniref:Zinc finger LSD1-type domain-containing protein n=1 Tax=Oryza nivara TaxID=4536 RepID=A0A0E0JCA6_ORYNI
MQSQIVCHGCRNILLYPRGAPSVCCAVCHAVSSTAPSPGMDIAHLICGGCRTLLMYTRNATSVRCSCCDTVNLVRPVSSIAHLNCGQCQTVLMYPYGAPSVKCAICNFITNTGPTTQSQNVTVVVENPMTVDAKGKLVSNVVVGVTTGGKKINNKDYVIDRT